MMRYRIRLPWQVNCRLERVGFTVVELLVALAIVGLLISLFLPAVQASRERARRTQCASHLKQLGIALHSFESSHRHFPYTGASPHAGQMGLSPHDSLLAFVEPELFRKFDQHDMGVDLCGVPTSPCATNQALLKVFVPTFLCPSDSTVVGATNYRANMGIRPNLFRQSVLCPDPLNGRGAFELFRAVAAKEFRDGLSSTVMMSEKVLGDGDDSLFSPFTDRVVINFNFCANLGNAISNCTSVSSCPNPAHASFGGRSWIYGGMNSTWYDHILSPNAGIPDCSSSPATGFAGGGQGFYPARSFHCDGVNSLFADGSMKFTANSIDFMIWHAVGTRDVGEIW